MVEWQIALVVGMVVIGRRGVMDINAQQLVRLAELMNVSAGVLRDLLAVKDFDGESENLRHIASELERFAIKVKDVGFSGLPLPADPTSPQQ